MGKHLHKTGSSDRNAPPNLEPHAGHTVRIARKIKLVDIFFGPPEINTSIHCKKKERENITKGIL